MAVRRSGVRIPSGPPIALFCIMPIRMTRIRRACPRNVTRCRSDDSRLRRGDGTVNMPPDAPYSARVDRLKLSDHPDRRFTDAVDLDLVRDLELVNLRFTGFELRASGADAFRAREWRGWYTPIFPPPGNLMNARRPQGSSWNRGSTVTPLPVSSFTAASMSRHMRKSS